TSSRRQSTASLAGVSRIAASVAMPTVPPVRTIEAEPLAACTSTRRVMIRAATALASRSASRCTTTVGTLTCITLVGVRAGQPFHGQLVRLVGVEPAQFLGQQLRKLPPAEGHVPVGLAGTRQRGHPGVAPRDRQLAVVEREPDLGEPGPAGLGDADRDLQPFR